VKIEMEGELSGQGETEKVIHTGQNDLQEIPEVVIEPERANICDDTDRSFLIPDGREMRIPGDCQG